MGLLLKINGGIKPGNNNIVNLYVKVLPATLTMHTVHRFVTDLLDKVKIPWVPYRGSCKQILLPSSSAALSEEVEATFSSGSYARYVLDLML